MTKQMHTNLSRRERQIMDIIYKRAQATAVDVMENLPNAPSYSAVRAMLRLLEEKGYLKHQQDGLRYVYMPTVSREKARQSALKQMLQTFFDDSTEDAVATLLDISRSKLSDADLDRLQPDRRGKKGGALMIYLALETSRLSMIGSEPALFLLDIAVKATAIS